MLSQSIALLLCTEASVSMPRKSASLAFLSPVQEKNSDQDVNSATKGPPPPFSPPTNLSAPSAGPTLSFDDNHIRVAVSDTPRCTLLIDWIHDISQHLYCVLFSVPCASSKFERGVLFDRQCCGTFTPAPKKRCPRCHLLI